MITLSEVPVCTAGGKSRLSRKPAQRASTLLDFAGRERVSLPHTSKSTFGQGQVVGAGIDLGDVQLETTRTSRTYRARLEQALCLFLHWISFTAWCGVDWWLCPVKASQVLVELVEWQFTTGARICHSRHAILNVQTAFRDLKGHLGEVGSVCRAGS